MPLTVANGPLGLLGVHRWNGGLPINDLMSALPASKARAIRNFHSLPEADNNTESITGEDGENIYPNNSRGKTITYECTALGSDALELYEYVADLRAQFSDRSNPGSMVISPNPGFGSVDWAYNARVLDFSADDEISTTLDSVPTPYQLAYTLSMRQYEGSFYVPGGSIEGPFTAGSTHTIPNNGKLKTNLVIEGDISSTGIATIDITNAAIPIGTGIALLELYAPLVYPYMFTSPSFPTGHVVIDFATRRATLDDGAGTIYSLAGTVYTYFSTWWEGDVPGLVPGNNDITVTQLNNWTVSYVERA